ncbi:hypothetical protein S245_006624, partial [Arachis hypogaea]
TNRRKKDSAKKKKLADFQKEEHDQLSLKRIDSAMFEPHVKRRRNKEERSALAKAGREDRGKYLPRKAANQKKQPSEGTQEENASGCKERKGCKISPREEEKQSACRETVPRKESVNMMTYTDTFTNVISFFVQPKNHP